MDIGYRAMSYVIGIVTALCLAALIYRTKVRPLSNLFSMAMIAWAFNCTAMLVLLWFDYAAQSAPPARDAMMTVNATLMALCPSALLIVWKRGGKWN